MNYSEKVIELSKRTKQLTIVPFGQSFLWCNNNCSFCYLRNYLQKKPLSIVEVRKITQRIDEWLTEYKDKLEFGTRIKVNLLGGELFCLNEEYYNEYRNLLDTVINHVGTADITLFSNLLYSDVNMLYALSKDYNASIITSFDIEGRFRNEQDAELWWNNLNKLSAIGSKLAVEFTLSKSMINQYLNNDTYYTRLFDRVLNSDSWKVGGDILIPNNESSYDNIPTQEEVIEFYKRVYDKFGNKPNNNLLRYTDIEDDSQFSVFSDCARIQFDCNGVIELYCDDIHIMISKQNLKNKILKDEEIKDDFICMVNEDKIKYYFDNIYGCGTCKYRGYCKKYKLRECYRTRNYKVWNNKCWVKSVLKYVSKHGQ